MLSCSSIPILSLIQHSVFFSSSLNSNMRTEINTPDKLKHTKWKLEKMRFANIVSVWHMREPTKSFHWTTLSLYPFAHRRRALFKLDKTFRLHFEWIFILCVFTLFTTSGWSVVCFVSVFFVKLYSRMFLLLCFVVDTIRSSTIKSTQGSIIDALESRRLYALLVNAVYFLFYFFFGYFSIKYEFER